MTEPDWISLREAEELLTMKHKTVTKLLQEGKLFGKRRSRYWFKVDRKSVMDYLDYRTQRNLRPPSPLLQKAKAKHVIAPGACPRCGIIGESPNGGECRFCEREQATGEVYWYEALPANQVWKRGRLTL